MADIAKPKRKMTEKQLENLRLGRERAHQRMKNLQVETKELKQYKEKEAEPQEYNYDSDSSDDGAILKKYSKKKTQVIEPVAIPSGKSGEALNDVVVVPPKKGRTRKPIDLEEKRLKYEAKLLEKEYQMKMRDMESAHLNNETKVKPSPPAPPTRPKPIVIIG